MAAERSARQDRHGHANPFRRRHLLYRLTTISGGTLVLQDITDAGVSSRGTSSTTRDLGTQRRLNNAWSFSGVISGLGSLNVAGGNQVTINGSSGNTYTGGTTITNGTAILAKTSGYAIPGNLTISGGGSFVIVQNSNQLPATATINFAANAYAHLEVYGNTVTVGGISGTGLLENTEGETGVSNGDLIVNNSTDCLFNGYLRDTANGSGTFALVKNGPGTLTIDGAGTGEYTGGLTVNAGTLDYRTAHIAQLQLYDHRRHAQYRRSIAVDPNLPNHRRHGNRHHRQADQQRSL